IGGRDGAGRGPASAGLAARSGRGVDTGPDASPGPAILRGGKPQPASDAPPGLAILRGVTLQLAYTDSYARSVEGRIVAVHDAADGHGPLVVLDRTAFYPGGGGQ